MKLRNVSYYHLENVVYHSNNLILQCYKKGLVYGDTCIIFGTGNSLSIDENDNVLHQDNLIKYPDVSNFYRSTIYSAYIPFEYEGISYSSEELSYFINNCLNMYENVILIGHSIAGLCFASCLKHIKRYFTLVTVSTPFNYNNNIPIVNKYYDILYGEHIIINNVEFIQQNIKASNNNCKYINLISTITKFSDCNNIADNILYLYNKYYKNDIGDGVYSKKSQETFIKCSEQYEFDIHASHSKSLKVAFSLLNRLNLCV